MAFFDDDIPEDFIEIDDILSDDAYDIDESNPGFEELDDAFDTIDVEFEEVVIVDDPSVIKK